MNFSVANAFELLKEKAHGLGLQNLAEDLRNRAKDLVTQYLEEKDEGQVETLLDRVANEILSDDRREALLGLRDLLQSGSPLGLATFGEVGFPVLNTILRDERQDVPMVQAALETLLNGLAARAQPTPEMAARGVTLPDVSAINAELYARGPGHAELLLNLLEEEPVGLSDTIVRYEALRCLRRIAAVSRARLEATVLSHPTCIGRLMELVSSERELVRGEALGLLGQLAASSEHVQNIAAFENAFDRLAQVYVEEGGAWVGTPNATDALDLAVLLMRTNVKVIPMFRDMGFCPRILELLHQAISTLPLPTPSLAAELQRMTMMGQATASDPSNPQPDPNMARPAILSLLGVVHALIPRRGAAAPGKPAGFLDTQRSENIKAMGPQLLGMILALAFHPRLSAGRGVPGGGPLPDGATAAVRASCLSVIASLIDGQPELRDMLGASVVEYSAGPSHPMAAPPAQRYGVAARAEGPFRIAALHAVIRRALMGETPAEVAAALTVIETFCSGNSEGQALLSSTLTAPVEDSDLESPWYAYRAGLEPSPTVSPGAELVRSMIVAAAGGAAGPTGGPGPQAREVAAAASALSSVVAGNPGIAERLLSLPLQLTAGVAGKVREPSLLGLVLSLLARSVAGEAREPGSWGGAASTLLGLLCVWASASDRVGSAVLQRPDMAAVLSDAVRLLPADGPEAPWAHLGGYQLPPAGVAAALLATVAAASGAQGTWGARELVDYVAKNAGLGVVFGALDAFKASHAWRAAAAPAATFTPRLGVEPGPEMDAMTEEDTYIMSGGNGVFIVPILSNAEAAARGAVQHLYGAGAADPTTGAPTSARAALEAEAAQALHPSLPPERMASNAHLLVQSFLRRVEEIEVRNRVLMQSATAAGGRGDAAGGRAASPAPGQAAAGAAGQAGLVDRISEAELRASRAEAAAARLEGDVSSARAREESVRQAFAELESRARDLQTVLDQRQSELASLGQAYAELEAHSRLVEREKDEAERRAAGAAAGAAAASSAGPPAGFISEAEAEARAAAAAAKAREEAEAEGEDGMNDLLVCLGQEEAKVERLRRRLEELGEDVDGMLEGIAPGGEGGGEEE